MGQVNPYPAGRANLPDVSRSGSSTTPLPRLQKWNKSDNSRLQRLVETILSNFPVLSLVYPEDRDASSAPANHHFMAELTLAFLHHLLSVDSDDILDPLRFACLRWCTS